MLMPLMPRSEEQMEVGKEYLTIKGGFLAIARKPEWVPPEMEGMVEFLDYGLELIARGVVG